MQGELKKLKIEAYKDIKYSEKADEYVVLFNPTAYVQKYEVEYKEAQGQGTTGSNQKFGKIKPQEYSFEFIFDGTGVTDSSSASKDVHEEIDKFLTITGKMDSNIHRPYYLLISWGTLYSTCVLKSADITYTLFKPDGYPLRANVKATFSENIEDTLRTAKEGKNSPDLTHQRIVKDGDTLPLMTYRIYGDDSYYLEVARINGLTDFRKLKTGTIIQFPPLKQEEVTSS